MADLTFGPNPAPEDKNVTPPVEAAELAPVAGPDLTSAPEVAVPTSGHHFSKKSLLIVGIAGFVLVAGAGAYFATGTDSLKGSFRDARSTQTVDRAIVAEEAQVAQPEEVVAEPVQEEPVKEETAPVETAKVEEVEKVETEPVLESAQQPAKEESSISTNVAVDSGRVARKPRGIQQETVKQEAVIENSFSNEKSVKEEAEVVTVPVFDPTSFKFVSAPGLESGTNTISYNNDFKQAISFKYLLPIYETTETYDYNGKLYPPLYSVTVNLELCNANLDVCDQISANDLAVQKNVKDVESRQRQTLLQAAQFKTAVKNFVVKGETGMMIRFRVLDPRGMYHYTKAFKLSIPKAYLDALK